MSSLAQEESRSISENCTWGQRKRFADGKVTVPFKRFLGYDRGEDGNLVINPEQAEVVKRIYGMFLKGMTPHGIAKTLTDEGIPTPAGKHQVGPDHHQEHPVEREVQGRCHAAEDLLRGLPDQEDENQSG